ncbi:MAG: enoyl-CoA hydratase-related protein [Myxococcota bacterium]|nr:enoyl-CoA hydratase-related protein [Myxococcota bacterium]
MSKVIVEEHEQLWLVRINAPERRNALGREVVEGLLDVARRVEAQKAIRCVILSSAGDKAFCAGADLKERKGMPEPAVRAFVSLLNDTFNAIANSSKVWIAAIHGACLGGGLELALTTDIRVAHTNAKMGLPEVRLGILPGAGGTQRLPRLIGIARAKELILTGARIGAEEALRVGLVNRVSDDYLEEAHRVAADVCKGAPISLTQAKKAIDQGWDLHMDAGLRWERTCYDVTIPTQDRLEGLRAFAEKRPPIYRGE